MHIVAICKNNQIEFIELYESEQHAALRWIELCNKVGSEDESNAQLTDIDDRQDTWFRFYDKDSLMQGISKELKVGIMFDAISMGEGNASH